MTLEQYFHKIVNQPIKETQMLDLSMFFTAQLEKLKSLFNTRYEFTVDVPQQEVEDSWAFCMRTGAYEVDGEIVEAKHDHLIGVQDTTWMEVLDQILDVMGKHYGYNIKEQVYYSVTFPLNDPECAGYGRELNDELFQQILLIHPELYTCKSMEWMGQ